MSESPVVPPPVVEMPVMDPEAFLLHRANQDFLGGQRTVPITETKNTDGTLAVVGLSMVGVLVGVSIIAGGNGVLEPTIIGIFLLLGAFVAGAVAVQSSHTAGGKAVGKVIEGRVLEAEKIRIQTGKGSMESIGVRYEFVTPEGRRLHSRAEAPLQETGRTMAPAPGTPVYIWYESEERHYLL
jgi:hypothetical protein